MRLRLRGRLDAQGSRPRPCRGGRAWREPAGVGADRPVLCRGSGARRQSPGYLLAAASLRAVMRAAAAALALAQPHSYGLIDNVTGYTIDDQGHLRRFAGLLIDDTGKVDRLLNPGDKAPGSLSFRLDAHGKVLIPGLADAHGHVVELGLRTMRLDLAGTRSLAAMQARLTAWAGSHSAPKWIIGYGLDPATLGM